MSIPLHRSRFARARWLVLAPHADDETLGAGALIVQAAAERRLAGVVYLTDGAGSHVAGGAWLARRRRQEAGLAIRRLAGRAPAPVFLDWPDAQPFAPGSTGWSATVDRLAALICARRVDAVAVTGAEEPHCDHAAFHAVARAAIWRSHRPVALFGYRVWTDPAHPPARLTLRTRAMPPGRRRHALMAHRSQTSAAFGPGFRVPRTAWRMPAHDILHGNRT